MTQVPSARKILDELSRAASVHAACDRRITALEDEVATLDQALNEVLVERDRLHERLDELAYAVAPEAVIGEHSSMNGPWRNALNILTMGEP